jgi:hypothetical protein
MPGRREARADKTRGLNGSTREGEDRRGCSYQSSSVGAIEAEQSHGRLDGFGRGRGVGSGQSPLRSSGPHGAEQGLSGQHDAWWLVMRLKIRSRREELV